MEECLFQKELQYWKGVENGILRNGGVITQNFTTKWRNSTNTKTNGGTPGLTKEKLLSINYARTKGVNITGNIEKHNHNSCW